MSKAVLIMDMPENCYECKFFISRESYCSAKKEYVNSLAEYVRPDECPLKQVPEEIHNELYFDEYTDGYDDGWNSFRNVIISEED